MEIAKLLNALPGAVSQGIIWGIMAVGVYITYKILDVADLTVDGSIATGGAVAAMLIIGGCDVWVAMLVAVLAGVIVLGALATFAVSRLLSATLLRGLPSAFTLELPPFRRPQVGRVIVRSVVDRTLRVLGRAAAVAAPAGLVISRRT